MLPAPGVYEALMMLLQITVSAWTTPEKRDIPESTVTRLADTATWLACTVISVWFAFGFMQDIPLEEETAGEDDLTEEAGRA